MKDEYTLAGRKVTLHESIDTLSVEAWQRLNKALMIDALSGANVDAVTEKISLLGGLIEGGQREKAMEELQNLQQSLNFALDGISPLEKSFAYLISAIDGKPVSLEDAEAFVKTISVDDLRKHSSRVGEFFRRSLTSTFRRLRRLTTAIRSLPKGESKPSSTTF